MKPQMPHWFWMLTIFFCIVGCQEGRANTVTPDFEMEIGFGYGDELTEFTYLRIIHREGQSSLHAVRCPFAASTIIANSSSASITIPLEISSEIWKNVERLQKITAVEVPSSGRSTAEQPGFFKLAVGDQAPQKVVQFNAYPSRVDEKRLPSGLIPVVVAIKNIERLASTEIKDNWDRPVPPSELVTLFHKLYRSDPSVGRLYAARALALLGSIPQDALVSSDGDVRYWTLWGLYERGDPTSVNVFLQVLQDADKNIRRLAVLALGDLGAPQDEQVISALRRIAEREPDLRDLVQRAIEKLQ